MLWIVAIIIFVILFMHYHSSSSPLSSLPSFFSRLIGGGNKPSRNPTSEDMGERQIDSTDSYDQMLGSYFNERDAASPPPAPQASSSAPPVILSGASDEGLAPLPALIFQT